MMSEEPVAGYMGSYGNKHVIGLTGEGELSVGDMLYLNPPKTKATVYLTRDEIEYINHGLGYKNIISDYDLKFARAIEQEVLRRNK